MGEELADAAASTAPRVLIFGGFILVALGTGIALWLQRHGPSRILEYEAAYVVGYVLIASAWWQCIPAMRIATTDTVAVVWGLRLFAVASLVLTVGYIILISQHAHGWNLVTLGLEALGFLSASCGFWVTTLDRKEELPSTLSIAAGLRE